MKDTLRPGAHAAAPPGTYALVGGTTSVYADIQRAVNHDYAVVFRVAGAVILVILAMLLRSAVAPWYLMASVGLGFGATLGASVLVFQSLRGEAGLCSRRPYLLSGVLLVITAQLFKASALNAVTQTLCWTVIFFFASAGASAGYLTPATAA